MTSTRPYATVSTGLGLALPPTSLPEIRLPTGARAPFPSQAPPASWAHDLQDDPHHAHNAIQHSPTSLAARDAAADILAAQKEKSHDSLSPERMAAFASAVLALPTPHHLAPYLSSILPATLCLLSCPDVSDPAVARKHALKVLEHVFVHLCSQPYSKAQPTSAHLLRRSNWHSVLWDALMNRLVLMDTIETQDEVPLVGACLVGLMDLRSGEQDSRSTASAELSPEQEDERSVEWINDWGQGVERVLKVLEMRVKMLAELRLQFTTLLTHLLGLTTPTMRLTYARRSITQLSLAIQWLSSARQNSALQLLGVHALTQVQALFLSPWNTPLPPPVARQLPRLLAAIVMASAGTLDLPTNVQDDDAKKAWAVVKERLQKEYVDQDTWVADVAMVRQAIGGLVDQGEAVDGAIDPGVSALETGLHTLSV